MKYRKKIITVLLTLLIANSLYGVNFSELNLSQDNRMLFKAEFEYKNAVFISSLDTQDSMQQLTAIPEKLQLVDNGRTVIALNKFGAVKIPVTGGLPVPLPGTPSFTGGNIPLKGRLQEAAVSNDGKWALYIEPVSPAYGTLFIANTSNGAKHIVSEKVELPAQNFPAKWSPDSRLFVYEKDSKLFYYPILSDLSIMVNERFRYIGTGNITAAVWGQQGDFFYFTGNTLYSIRNPELFTRTIYGDFLSIGNVSAILPFEFDSGFDQYWAAPDSKSILINKDNKGLFLFFLNDENEKIINAETPSANVIIPDGAQNFSVLWSSSGRLSVIFTIGDKTNTVRYEITNSVLSGKAIKNIPVSNNPLSSSGDLSPDGTKAVFWGEKGIELWDFTNWRLLQKIKNDETFSCAWVNNGRFIAGNKKQIEEINIAGTNITQRRLCLSGADETGFEVNTRGQSRVLARFGSDWYATDTRSAWVSVNDPQIRPISLSTDRYRIYLESLPSGNFKNTPMIRNITGIGTSSFTSNFIKSGAYPEVRSMKIALCFDLYDDNTGLYQVLAALKRSGIKASFFLNGEFIRRHPQSAKAIAEAGHETASMFYAPVDLADSRYRITQDFITRGLSRNEDEYNNATGKELALIWHPPFYRNSDLITASAKAAGYTTAERTIDLFDWLTYEDSIRLNLRRVSASAMIEQITNSRINGAVIPIRLGRLAGGRDEYLYQRISVLLDALARSGIEVVPVSNVVK